MNHKKSLTKYHSRLHFEALKDLGLSVFPRERATHLKLVFIPIKFLGWISVNPFEVANQIANAIYLYIRKEET